MKTRQFVSLRHLSAVVLVSFLIALASCNNEQTTHETTDDNTSQASTDTREFEYPVPTPFEVTNVIIKSGASYQFDLTNPVENSDKYFTEKDKALNLGVYGADLSYYSTYNKPNETRNYLSGTRKLTDELEIATAFDQTIVDRVENNIDNTDSLHLIISDSFYETFDYLNKNEKGGVSVLIIAGGWIEGLYLSTQLSNTASDKKVLMESVANQKGILTKLMSLLDTYKQNESINEVITEFGKIKTVFDAASTPMTDKEFEALVKVTEEIRNQIVNVKAK